MIAATLALLAAAQSVSVQDMPDGQFRITVAARSMGSDVMTRAMLAGRAEAARRCQGRGDPAEVGGTAFVVGANGGWRMITIYTCHMAAAPAEPAPPPGQPAQPEQPAPPPRGR